MNQYLRSAIFTGLLLVLPAFGQAQTYATRLDRIKENGILVAAYRENAIPFSYLINGTPSGFGVALTERIAAELRQQLGRPDLRIRWNAVTLSTRIPMIMTNTVDISCSSDTNTLARQKMVDFSLSYLISENGIAVSKDSGIKHFADLAGKRVAVLANSTAETYLKTERNMNTSAISVPNNGEAMSQLRDGKVDAYLNGDSIVAGQLLRLSDGERFELLGGGGLPEAFGCMLPKGDVAFKQVVDGILAGLMKSGEMEALYNTWFVQPIRPFGKALNLPLNDASRRLYESPDDQPR